MKKPSKVATLSVDLMKVQANDILRLSTSHREVAKLTQERFMASGVILSIRSLSGNVLIDHTMIADGLSAETIAALQADIKRTYEARLDFNKIS